MPKKRPFIVLPGDLNSVFPLSGAALIPVDYFPSSALHINNRCYGDPLPEITSKTSAFNYLETGALFMELPDAHLHN